MPPKSQYTHLSQRNQILKRPTQHIGSVKNTIDNVWLADTVQDESGCETTVIREKEISSNKGLIHIFYEILANAQDNKIKTDAKIASKQLDCKPQKYIHVTVDQETGTTSVENDGAWIPAIVHEWEEGEEIIDTDPHYEAEIIFGHLNSSSNYDETQDREGAGLHGHGAKLTNIFSTDFEAEAFDPESQQIFIGNWQANMSKFNGAKTKTCKKKTGYTKITYTPDFKRFSLNGYSNDHIAVMKKLCFDCAMVTGIKVTFNGETIPVKNLLTYANYYTDGNKLEFKSSDSQVILCERDDTNSDIQQISFVNGVLTTYGGVHVKKWEQAIMKPLIEKLKNKYSGKKSSTPLKLDLKSIRKYFTIFVNCNLKNPEFEGQTKGILASPAPKTEVSETRLNQVLKWDFVQDIEETVRIQGLKELKKTDGSKTKTVNIANYDDANKAGGPKSADCTLYITEGLSAKTFAVKGISTIENGTDFYGVLPLRGKLINVRKESVAKINDNKEITAIKKALGLEHGIDYSTKEKRKRLRYGCVRILTDADPDGDHIKGLILNFFHYFYPSLIDCGFVKSIRTPIVKARIGKQTQLFYNLNKFERWVQNTKSKYSADHYKGLGTSEDEEIFEVFEDPYNVTYTEDVNVDAIMRMVFHGDESNARKKWLEKYNPEHSPEYEQDSDGEEIVPAGQFVDEEMIHFSIYSNERAIPSCIDGQKTSQRKAIWASDKILPSQGSSGKGVKVKQLAGEVAKKAAYQHGEDSMAGSIVKQAQTYTGSNNVTPFYESGQFGTRLSGGDDAADPRYIFTKKTEVFPYIFRKEDNPILDYVQDDGKNIEPKFFVPTIPMLPANGASGMGTGHSTNIPSYNPLDLVDWVRCWLDGTETPELTPWYWNFKGTIEKKKNGFVSKGIVEKEGDHYLITELPVGMWTDTYKDHLNTLQTGVNSSKKAVKKGYDALTTPQLKEEIQIRNKDIDTEIADLSPQETKDFLKKRPKLKVTGKKQDLVDRLKADDKKTGNTMKKTGTSGQLVKKWEWHGDAYNVKFKVWTNGDPVTVDDPNFKLTSSISTSNMVAFMPSGGIKKYKDTTEIMEEYCNVRYDYYGKRKEHLIGVLERDLATNISKEKFLASILKDPPLITKIAVWDDEKLNSYCEKQGYWPDPDANEPFGYLINTMSKIRKVSRDSLKETIKGIKDEIEYVKKKTCAEMWTSELDEFVTVYKKWKAGIEEKHVKLAKMKGKKGKGKRGKGKGK